MKAEDISQRDIIITKPTIDIMREEKHFLELAGLYTFYYYTAVWQKTNQPKATTAYTAEGTNTTETKIRKLKKILIRLGFIQNVVTKNEEGQITGHYIRVMFYRSHPIDKPPYSKTHRVGRKRGNAYIDNSSNSYKDNTGTKKRAELVSLKDSSFNGKAAKKLSSIISKNNKMSRKVSTKRWSQEIRMLRVGQEIEKSRIVKVINWLAIYINDEFTPKLYKAIDFREKFTRIEDAMNRSNKKVENGEQKIKYTEKRRKAK